MLYNSVFGPMGEGNGRSIAYRVLLGMLFRHKVIIVKYKDSIIFMTVERKGLQVLQYKHATTPRQPFIGHYLSDSIFKPYTLFLHFLVIAETKHAKRSVF